MAMAPRARFTTVLAASVLASCGGKVEPFAIPPTPDAWDRPVVRPDASEAARTRAECGFRAGAMPAETLGADTPVDLDLPIEKVVIVMMENRSFDHYFGLLGAYAGRSDVEVAPLDATNPDHVGRVPGALHPRRHAPHLCARDTEHSWAMSHLEWDEGKMDGFF